MADSKFFNTPFAATGDRTEIPNGTDPTGAVSYQQGFGPDYERDPATDPLAKRVPRAETNEYLYQMTNALKFLQLYGVGEWYADDGTGNPLAYPVAAQVRHNNVIWTSLVASNTATPGTDATRWTQTDPFSFGALLATQAQAQARTANDRVMSPLRTNDAIQASRASQAQAESRTNDATLMTPLRDYQALLANLFQASQDRGLENQFSTNGFLKLPSYLGGLQICWGQAAVPIGTATVTVPVARPFNTAILQAVATDAGAGTFPAGITFGDRFNVQLFTNPDSLVTLRYFAIGY